MTDQIMMRNILILSFAILFTAPACESKADAPGVATSTKLQMPKQAKPSSISVDDFNCWIENGNFYVAGICNNLDMYWNQVWLRVEPLDAEGKPIALKSGVDDVIRVLSDAVPPRGRSSFFAGWPVTAFNGVPDSARMISAGSMQTTAGPILIPEEISGVKMLFNKTSDSVEVKENQWLTSFLLNNALNVRADKPRAEILLYGRDKKLYFSMVLNPDDPAMKQTINLEKGSPIEPGEKRRFSAYVFYQGLPQKLQDVWIGRVDFIPFNGR